MPQQPQLTVYFYEGGCDWLSRLVRLAGRLKNGRVPRFVHVAAIIPTRPNRLINLTLSGVESATIDEMSEWSPKYVTIKWPIGKEEQYRLDAAATTLAALRPRVSILAFIAMFLGLSRPSRSIICTDIAPLLLGMPPNELLTPDQLYEIMEL